MDWKRYAIALEKVYLETSGHLLHSLNIYNTLMMFTLNVHACFTLVFPPAHLKQGGPPGLNLEHQRKWVEFEATI